MCVTQQSARSAADVAHPAARGQPVQFSASTFRGRAGSCCSEQSRRPSPSRFESSSWDRRRRRTGGARRVRSGRSCRDRASV